MDVKNINVNMNFPVVSDSYEDSLLNRPETFIDSHLSQIDTESDTIHDLHDTIGEGLADNLNFEGYYTALRGPFDSSYALIAIPRVKIYSSFSDACKAVMTFSEREGFAWVKSGGTKRDKDGIEIYKLCPCPFHLAANLHSKTSGDILLISLCRNSPFEMPKRLKL